MRAALSYLGLESRVKLLICGIDNVGKTTLASFLHQYSNEFTRSNPTSTNDTNNNNGRRVMRPDFPIVSDYKWTAIPNQSLQPSPSWSWSSIRGAFDPSLYVLTMDLGGMMTASTRRMWSHNINTCDGVVYMIDATDHQRCPEAIEGLGGVMEYLCHRSSTHEDIPLLILLNKLDQLKTTRHPTPNTAATTTPTHEQKYNNSEVIKKEDTRLDKSVDEMIRSLPLGPLPTIEEFKQIQIELIHTIETAMLPMIHQHIWLPVLTPIVCSYLNDVRPRHDYDVEQLVRGEAIRYSCSHTSHTHSCNGGIVRALPCSILRCSGYTDGLTWIAQQLRQQQQQSSPSPPPSSSSSATAAAAAAASSSSQSSLWGLLPWY
jgi:GTPase SAR1 family protein